MTTAHDHREVIHDVAERYSAAARDVLTMLASDDPETIDSGLDEAVSMILSTEVFTSTSDSTRHYVEMLLAYGGPTTMVTVDPDGVVIFHHTWGKDHLGRDLRQLHLDGDAGEVWRDLAYHLAEMGV